MPSDDITRLYTFTAGTTIVAAQANGELDQLVTTMNNKVGRATTETISGTKTFSAGNSHTGNNTFSGQNSFSDATAPIKTDRIDAYTATRGVRINSISSDPASVAAGDLWYNSTSNVYKFRNGSTTLTLASTADVPAAAAQSDQETATSTTTYVTPGRQQFHPSAAKAWVRFNGTGTVAIAGSHNVTSITDNGTGDYTINFTTAFSGASTYAGVVSCGMGVAGSAMRLASGPVTVASTASAWRLETTNIAGTLTDTESINAVFFGDQ